MNQALQDDARVIGRYPDEAGVRGAMNYLLYAWVPGSAIVVLLWLLRPRLGAWVDPVMGLTILAIIPSLLMMLLVLLGQVNKARARLVGGRLWTPRHDVEVDWGSQTVAVDPQRGYRQVSEGTTSSGRRMLRTTVENVDHEPRSFVTVDLGGWLPPPDPFCRPGR